MEFKKIIGKGIKLARKAKNLTQEDLAEKIGMSTQNLSSIERGIYFPKPENVDKICEVFNITPDVLCRPAALPNKNKLDIIHHINSILGTLEVEELEQIFKIAKTFEK